MTPSRLGHIYNMESKNAAGSEAAAPHAHAAKEVIMLDSPLF